MHFWGGNRLGPYAGPWVAVLRAAGYPLRLAHFSALVRQGAWVMTPVRWKSQRRVRNRASERIARFGDEALRPRGRPARTSAGEPSALHPINGTFIASWRRGSLAR